MYDIYKSQLWLDSLAQNNSEEILQKKEPIPFQNQLLAVIVLLNMFVIQYAF